MAKSIRERPVGSGSAGLGVRERVRNREEESKSKSKRRAIERNGKGCCHHLTSTDIRQAGRECVYRCRKEEITVSSWNSALMIIDIHTHAFPDALAERAVSTLSAVAQVPTHSDGTCEGLRRSQQIAGIALSVIAPIATKPAQARAINAWAAEVNRHYDDLLCFGSLHPAQQDWAEEIARLVEDGIRGVKFHADYQDFFVDEPRVLPIYRALAGAGLIVLFHAGVDIGLPPPVHCPPARLAHVLDAVPELVAIASHMGGYAQWTEVKVCLLGRDLYFDTSYSLADLGAEHMTALIQGHGAHRVLFGTDSPWTDQVAEVGHIGALPLSDEEKAAILGENARGLLGR